MARGSLTVPPTAPVLVRAAVVSALLVPVPGCGGDDSMTSASSQSSSDVPPTDSCIHDPTSCPESTSQGTATGGTEGGTMSTTQPPTTTDVPPTDVCSHNPDDPLCGSTGPADTTAGDTAATSSGSGGTAGTAGTGGSTGG